MNLHRVTYTVKDDEGVKTQRRKFAASGAEASKIATALKKDDPRLVGKPERDEVDVPTNKAGLIAFLNSGEA